LYLIFISGLTGSYLGTQVKRAVERGAAKTHEDFVRNLASGWAAQLGFMNAMFAALSSMMSVWSASRSFVGVVIAFAFLLAIFIPMMRLTPARLG
jgi:hypothetical protein